MWLGQCQAITWARSSRFSAARAGPVWVPENFPIPCRFGVPGMSGDDVQKLDDTDFASTARRAHLKCDPGPSLSPAPLTLKFGRAQRGADRAQYFPESERTWCWRWSVRGGRRRRPARAGHTDARPGSAVAGAGRAKAAGGWLKSEPTSPAAHRPSWAAQTRARGRATPLPSPLPPTKGGVWCAAGCRLR